MNAETFQRYSNSLKDIIPSERLVFDLPRRLAYGTDASFYRLIPQIVIKVRSESEIVNVLHLSAQCQVAVTFRAAGTSLSGQAITDSVLITLDSNWTRSKIEKEGQLVSLEPGLTGAQVNRLLLPYKRKIGPDPASINSAQIGGIAANNASGMCCGIAQNSYQTLKSMKLILADGTKLDTGSATSRQAFEKSHNGLLIELTQLREAVLSDVELTNRIEQKYKIKNTTGYSLNALIDFEDPFEILQHLFIGSEGTLGFISEITYNTVPEFTDKASTLIFFESVTIACQAIPLLKQVPVAAAELMDYASLCSASEHNDLGIDAQTLPEGAAALLVETRAESKEVLEEQITQIQETLKHVDLLFPAQFTAIPEEFNKLWKIRKGLFPTVGTIRKLGTTVIIEDIAFPLEHLANATLALQGLFKKHGYDNAIIFGHAFEGNIHFVFTQDFQEKSEVDRYQRFMDDVCTMVVEQFNGSLKAEHGTGRNMAPFVEMEWGQKAFDLMRQIKKLLDPSDILNPGVILNDDPEAHVKNLKPLPVADPLVDKCIECGFCEINCPSRNLTLTPRQRIVLWREISRLQKEDPSQRTLKSFQRAFQYYGEETCATDSLCSTACPVQIDTGKLIKKIRASQHSPRQEQLATWVGNNISTVARVAGASLGAANQVHRLLGTETMLKMTKGVRKLSGNRIPQWTPTLPKSVVFDEDRVIPKKSDKKVVYFSSCMARTMGPALDSPETVGLPETVLKVLHRAGFEVIFPKGLKNLCCGKAFESKGFQQAAQKKQTELETVLLEASDNGKYPILCETSPCLLHMKETFSTKLSLYEPLAFTEKYLLSHLTIQPTETPIVVHLTCSARKMGLEASLSKIANHCSTQVIIPDNVGCCGFAGDRGFYFPELNQSALQSLRDQIPQNCKDGYSTSCTCEIGLSQHGEVPYRSIFYLLEQVSQ